MKILSIAMLLCILVTGKAQAVPIVEFIDNGRTTITNIEGQMTEWLDLTETLDISFNDITADLADSVLDDTLSETSEFSTGWRYAQMFEIQIMAFNFFADISGTPILNESNMFDFIQLFGNTLDDVGNGALATMGMSGTDVAGVPGEIEAVQFIGGAAPEMVDWVWDKDTPLAGGSWLIRDYTPVFAAVSAPASIALFVFGLMGIHYRRKNA
ncbi:hypothetical protein Q4575_01925 [Psychrosphaera sp. 1_MG-2023]|uniref:hypothetical protein n=1 Tax=Psychrosphaera sp. 1_MG-2023 TaxID=3062643 RepID=UPI0026E21150|nr:hypothetical protein [Psychrosphaera sp. 1_MG-2023]MDO6718137.1 hypothetical protein [Psychrosphaera sp. 1_MG-2023]